MIPEKRLKQYKEEDMYDFIPSKCETEIGISTLLEMLYYNLIDRLKTVCKLRFHYY